MFETEAELVKSFLDLLRAKYLTQDCEGIAVTSEFDYRRGRTDVVVLTNTGEVIAYEAKLTRWRYALHQAYRNRCFSDRSYVLLPGHVAKNAAAFRCDFNARRVGICAIWPGGLEVVREAPRSKPTQPWLTEIAAARASATDCQSDVGH